MSRTGPTSWCIAAALYQEKVHPKVLIDDLLKQTRERREKVGTQVTSSLTNGIPKGRRQDQFYRQSELVRTMIWAIACR
jgi:hypothetical protein